MQAVQHIKFDYTNAGNKKTIEMEIPKSAKLIKITAGGEGKEYHYLYPDSSLIYITDMSGAGTINEQLIDKNQDNYNKRFSADTASFEGIKEDSTYWKEVKWYKLFYGYSNVPLSKKNIYDKVLSSVKYK
jgi:hypothetical protein